MTDSYSETPTTIGEIRSEKSQDAADWTPRDVLVSLLREIDRGELKPEALVVCIKENDGGRWSAASPNRITTVGLLETCKLDMFGYE